MVIPCKASTATRLSNWLGCTDVAASAKRLSSPAATVFAVVPTLTFKTPSTSMSVSPSIIEEISSAIILHTCAVENK